jgi:hypothetical protein
MPFVCTCCGYPSRRDDGCDNPACPENLAHSPAWRAELLAREERRRAELAAEAERLAARQRLRESVRRSGGTSVF